MKGATQEEAEAVTLVFWDMIKFPVPQGFDPRLVRPCTKRFLESHGYSGPLTITAYGELTDVPNDILRGLFSSGIGLTHVAADRMCMVDNIDLVMDEIPPPANILILSEPFRGLSSFFGRMDYNVLQPFKCKDAFRSFLLAAATDSEETGGVSAYWDCFVCRRDPPGQSFENFTAHLSSEEHQELALRLMGRGRAFRMTSTSFVPSLHSPKSPLPYVESWDQFCKKHFVPLPSGPPQINKEAVTSVFWDIIKCPVPPSLDSRRAGPSIKRYLKNGGYSGPLTITAVGDLTKVPDDVLRGVYSSGIGLTYVIDGSKEISGLVYKFTWSNPPPANILLISNTTMYTPRGYNLVILPSFEYCLWHGVPQEDNLSETGELVCTVCSCLPDHATQGYKNFITHLSSRAHQRKLLDSVPMGVRISQRQPLN